jgi:guanylate kinase
MSGLKKLVLYNSRESRPGEIDGKDYHFRKREFIEQFQNQSRYLVNDVRGDLQAIDLEQAHRDLEKSPLFFEGNPFVVETLLKSPGFENIDAISLFLSPLSREEIKFLKTQKDKVDLHDFVTDIMRRKLLRRTQKQKNILSQKDLANIERRVSSALKEMTYACQFDYVIANHDGEDSENWDAFYFPVGDARRTFNCVAALLQGHPHRAAEKWESDLFTE